MYLLYRTNCRIMTGACMSKFDIPLCGPGVVVSISVLVVSISVSISGFKQLIPAPSMDKQSVRSLVSHSSRDISNP